MHPLLPTGILAGIVGGVRHSAASGWHLMVPPGVIDGAVRIGFALLAFLVCWLLRKPLQWLLVRVLGWLVHLTKGSREVSRAALNARIREIVAIPTNYLALAISLDVAAQILHFAGLAELLTRLAYTLFGIMVALLVGRYINHFIIGRDRRLDLLGLAVEPPLLPFLHSFVWAFIFFILLVAIMQGWGFDPAALIAGTGLIGLALSLAAKDTADNLLGYFIIVAERPFLIGDFIKAGDVAGVVEHVGWRSTKVRQMDQVLVTVPNKNLTSANIANSQRMAKQMLETHLNVAYNAPPAAIQAFLDSVRTMLAARPLVEPDSIVALLLNLNKDSLDVLVRCNILETRWLLFRTEQEAIMLELLRLVEDAGLEVALPSQKVLVQAVAPAPGVLPADTANGSVVADHPDERAVETTPKG